jgi:hypothetical protein
MVAMRLDPHPELIRPAGRSTKFALPGRLRFSRQPKKHNGPSSIRIAEPRPEPIGVTRRAMGPKADMVGAPVEREPAGHSGGKRLTLTAICGEVIPAPPGSVCVPILWKPTSPIPLRRSSTLKGGPDRLAGGGGGRVVGLGCGRVMRACSRRRAERLCGELIEDEPEAVDQQRSIFLTRQCTIACAKSANLRNSPSRQIGR